jgi:hypothetical protein
MECNARTKGGKSFETSRFFAGDGRREFFRRGLSLSLGGGQCLRDGTLADEKFRNSKGTEKVRLYVVSRAGEPSLLWRKHTQRRAASCLPPPKTLLTAQPLFLPREESLRNRDSPIPAHRHRRSGEDAAKLGCQIEIAQRENNHTLRYFLRASRHGF